MHVGPKYFGCMLGRLGLHNIFNIRYRREANVDILGSGEAENRICKKMLHTLKFFN